jgi:radical SAM-linked protein
MKTIRVLFQKDGRAVYISHLDLMRAMSRALARSELPVWYTEGFHPHLYLTFALPLSLGTTGLCETMDFRLTGDVPLDEVTARLDAALPEGLHAVRAWEPVMAPKEIFWADYRVELRCASGEAEKALAALSSMEELPMEKRSKKGIRTVNIRPLFEVLSVEGAPGGAVAVLRCRAGVEINLNPTLLLDAAREHTGFTPVAAKIIRFAVLTENFSDFQ